MTKKAFLLAYPAGHSLSPYMHNAAFKALGIDGYYEALEIHPDDLAGVIDGFRAEDVYGSNVTIPHKLAVIPFMDELSQAAKMIGAVNTIINQNGKLLGHNTDASGYLRALREDGAFDPSGKEVLLLGAGGAARALLFSLLQVKAKVYIQNRTLSKAQELAENFKSLGNCEAIPQEAIPSLMPQLDLIVNSTSVGMIHKGQVSHESPLDLDLFKNDLKTDLMISDIVYRPAKTPLLTAAEAKSLRHQNGLAMLVYQGADSFEMWTGQIAPTQVMFEAIHLVIH
ncbi:MAG: shikimate dehydrogenase [Deinococcales bacterium]